MSSVKITGQKEIVQRLRQARQKMPTIMRDEEVGQFMVDRIKRRFDKEVSPSGEAWAALTDEYAKRKEKKYGRARKLVATGLMRSEIRVIRGSNLDTFAINTGLDVRVGIDSSFPDVQERARAHQYGTGRMAARPFLGLNASDREAVTNKLKRAIQRNLGG